MAQSFRLKTSQTLTAFQHFQVFFLLILNWELETSKQNLKKIFLNKYRVMQSEEKLYHYYHYFATNVVC